MLYCVFCSNTYEDEDTTVCDRCHEYKGLTVITPESIKRLGLDPEWLNDIAE